MLRPNCSVGHGRKKIFDAYRTLRSLVRIGFCLQWTLRDFIVVLLGGTTDPGDGSLIGP